jgi:uncharacterized membrane protein
MNANDEASYLRLASAWRRVHSVEAPARWPKVLVGIAAFILLTPVMAMVLVFAVIPALPIALMLGTILGPMNLISKGDREEENEAFEIWHDRLAHA